MATLVVGGDGDVDVLGGRVGVAERNDGDVDVGSLLDGLGVGAGVGDDDQTGLLEGSSDVVGEGAGGEAAGNGNGAGVGGELEDRTLAVGAGGDDTDVGGVVDSGDDAGGEDDLLPIAHEARLDRRAHCMGDRGDGALPGLANVNDVDTIGTGLPEVGLHVNLQVLGAEVALRSQQRLDILGGSRHAGGKVRGRHLELCGRRAGKVRRLLCAERELRDVRRRKKFAMPAKNPNNFGARILVG